MRTIRTDKKRRQFLAALAGGGSVRAACGAAGIGKSAAFDWRNDDADFAAAWETAIETGTDLLEDVAMQRALRGSDLLTIFLLKSRRPAKFREPRTLQLGGLEGAPPIATTGGGKVCIYLPHNDREAFKPDPE